MHIIRTYRCVAQIRHWCDRCCRYIEPREFYEGSVWALNSHALIVFKTYFEPSCDFPPDPEEEISKIIFEEIPWKLAA